MKKRLVSLVVVGAFLCVPLAAQTVDEIIAKNVAARGGLDKVKAVQTMRWTGRVSLGEGIEAPAVLELKRGNKMRLEFTVQGITAVQAYDGKSGWHVFPFQGKKDPEPIADEELKDVEEQADMDGPLVDYKAKGHKVELIGKEPVEGADCYKLKITLKNGDIRYAYLDTDSYLEIKGESKRTVRGNEMEMEESVGDYKEVEGLMLPHAFETSAKGSPQKQKIIIEKIELNVPLDDARFAMPAAAPAPATKP